MTSNVESSPIVRRLISPALAGLIVLASIFLFCGSFAIEVIIGTVRDSAMIALWLLAGFGFGRLITPKTQTLLSTITAIAVGIGAMGLLFQGLGLAGWLSRVSILPTITLGIVLTIIQLRNLRGTGFQPVSATQEHGLEAHATRKKLWFYIPLAIPLALGIVCVSLPPLLLWKPFDPHPYDVLSYHLQIPREWFDAKQIIPLTHNAFSYFPMLMETHYLAAMHVAGGPWKGMYLCQFISLAHGALAILAIAGVLLALNVSRVVAWSAAILAAGVPWMLMLSTVCYVEPGVMLYTTLAIGWALRALPDGRGRQIAGICGGLACGMKYTAFAMTLFPIFIAILGVGIFAKRRALIVNAIAFLLAGGLFASPWLIRNALWTGNPVFPLMTETFGKSHFTADQVDRYEAAHRPPDAEADMKSRLSNAWSRTVADPQFGWILIPAFVLAVFVSVRLHDARSSLLLITIGVTILVWIFATHDMPRFIAPVIPLLAIVIGLQVSKLNRFGIVAIASVAALQLIVGLAWLVNAASDSFALGRSGFFRLSDFTEVASPAVIEASVTGRKVALIGDAKAFLYPLPSSRLMYRSVFDVNVPPGVSTQDAWLGESIEELKQQGVFVIQDEQSRAEIERLSKTYRHLLPR